MKKILFIEDNFEIRDNVEEVLNLEGFHIITEPNGKDGLQRAKQEIPDIILCDIMMPELDGYEVLSELRRDPLTQHIPFIVVSSKVEKRKFKRHLTWVRMTTSPSLLRLVN